MENVRQEVQAFERSRQQYIMAIIKDLDMRFTNLMKDLEDFLVLHCADQEGTEKRLRSLVDRINKPGLTFEFLMKQWKIWEPILRKNPITDSLSLKKTVQLAIEHDIHTSRIPHIRMLYSMYILLPLSTASCERGFSSMKYIKSKRRNKLSENSLRYCMIISNHRWSHGPLNFRSIAEVLFESLRNKVAPKEYTLTDLMESLEKKPKKLRKSSRPAKIAKDTASKDPLKSSSTLKVSVEEGKLRQSFMVHDQMLWGENVDRCIQSCRKRIGKIDEEHTIVCPVNALWVLSDSVTSGISNLQTLVNWRADIRSHDIHAYFDKIADRFNNAQYMTVYMPLCVRNAHYLTVVLQKQVDGQTHCYVLDSTGRENFVLAGRQATVELLYSYIETTRLVLNHQNSDVIEVDTNGITEIEQQLQTIASMPLTSVSTMKITELAKKLELMKTPLRTEIKWLEGIEQDGSFECGLAVAGNIALLEWVTKGGLLGIDSVGDNFTAVCRTLPNAFGGIGYNRQSGFPALVEACALGLCTDAQDAESNMNTPVQFEKSRLSKISHTFDKISSPMISKKRKLRQINLMDFFRTPAKKPKSSKATSNLSCKKSE